MTGRGAHRALLWAAVPAVLCVLGASASIGSPAAAGVGATGLPHGSRYVAMGSSYGAGYDIAPQESGDGLCGRSFVDYPHLVAKKLDLRLDDVTCGGAVTANALNTAQDGHLPQVDAVTRRPGSSRSPSAATTSTTTAPRSSAVSSARPASRPSTARR